MTTLRMAKERPEEALELFEEATWQAKQDRDTDLILTAQGKYIREALCLGRCEETVAMVTEYLEYAKTYCGDLLLTRP